PYPVNAFLARKDERQDVKSLLLAHRLVTLTGVAGIGKTRLAIQVAEELRGSYGDGVYFVALIGLTDAALVIQTAASALSLREEPDRPLRSTLIDYLKTKTLLLVWDNCDYLIKECRALAQVVLSECSQVTVLATSRRSLHVNGEVIHSVPPFTVPEEELT